MIAVLLTIAALTASGGSHPPASRPHVITYEVKTGDTLWAIAARTLGNPLRWPQLYAANRRTVGPDPNLILPGEHLLIRLGRAAASRGPGRDRDNPGRRAGDRDDGTARQRWQGAGGSSPAVPSGTLGCAGLASLWVAAGGDPRFASMAAKIAMAESGGNQYAHSPTDDYGYWQINASNGDLATYDAYGNARSAIMISQNGTNWYPWTTYTTGAYLSQC